ncbi:MAG: transporter substrate-binding domain-containing protein [Chloroflexota bacterium]
MSKRAYDILLIVLIIAAVIVAFLFARSLLNYFSGSGTAPTPVPPPVVTDPWQRIQASGMMTVGTSADYPPFTYINDGYELDGFDIALMREIGQALGVQITFRDMAFEGLGGAIQLGEIDAAIAAISKTPARDEVVDFSNVYYVSTDAILANQNSTIAAITIVTEMAGYRVGVQRGTVYERWLKTSLVDTGLMPDSNLHRYQLADQIVTDVAGGLIDLGVMDLLPAETAVSRASVKIVGSGLNEELYAIAMLNGASSLQTQINNALTQLSNSGRLNQLITQYLGVPLEQIPPTPTPLPVTPTPIPTATAVPCINGMTFIADLNLNDNNMQSPPSIPPGQPFRKWWRIQNSGTCSWDSSYRLTFAGGNNPLAQMGGQPTPIQGTVLPGQQYDIFVDFVAPLQPGTYQSFWNMTAPNGQTFGSRIWVGITVPAPSTATPAATQTPTPGIEFRVDRTQINEGECVTFNWNVVGATAVFFYKQGVAWQNNQVPLTGTQSDCPSSTTTYELRVQWPNGAVEVRQITIFVQESATAPTIYRFTVNPPAQIELGQCVTLDWWVEGSISNVQILKNNAVIRDAAPVAGNMPDCPNAVGQVTYGISASGPGGTSRQQVTINVNQAAPPTATPQPNTPTAVPPTATIQPPVIYSFTIQPQQIEAGQCISGSWSVGGGAVKVRILRNGQVILDNAPFNSSGTDCLNEAGTYVYRLEALNNQGQPTAEERTVTVTSATPALAGTSWNLTAYFDGSNALVSPIQGTQITASFTNDNRINGSAGCNTYDGLYTVSGSSLTISNVVVGRLACGEPAGIMEQEDQYLAAIQQSATYERNGNQLTLKNAQGQIMAQFQSAPVATPFNG